MNYINNKQLFFLEKFYTKNIKHSLINKYKYKNISELPLFKKVILNFGCNTIDLKQLSSSMLALKIISGQKAKITRAKKANITLKIRKGNPSGCFLTLQKSIMFYHLEKSIFNIFSKSNLLNTTQLKKMMKKNSLSYKLKNTFKLSELENHYYYFNKIGNLDITVVTTKIRKHEILFFLKSCQFPFSKKIT